MTDLAVISQTRALVSTSWQDQFSAWLVAHGSSAKTVSAYLSDLSRFSAWFAQVNLQPLAPELVTGTDLRAYREYSLGVEKVAASTWNRRRSTLAQLCIWALEAGHLNYNPFQGVRPMEEVAQAPHWLDRPDQARVMRQVERMANTATTDAWNRQAARDQAMVGLMRYCGLRVGEVVALDLGDISLSERAGRIVVRRGKGDKQRTIPMNTEARRSVEHWMALRGPGSGGEPVFTGKGTDRLTTRTVQRRVQEIARLAEVDFTPHQLRHTFLKRMVENGVPVTDAQKLAGHSRIETTKRYLTPGWEDLTAAVEKTI